MFMLVWQRMWRQAGAALMGMLITLATPTGAQNNPPAARLSGFDYMSPATQAMQRDDAQNPAMLWVREGESLWSRPAGASQRSCASCHGDARQTMRDAAARHPAWDNTLGRPLHLAGRIQQCRQRHQQAPAWPWGADELLSLEAWVAHQSRGQAMQSVTDTRLEPALQRGEARWLQRIGQLNLSCAQCHDARAGQRLGGNPIPQAHPTGYPIYRLEWQSAGTLHRRLRNCMTGVRAEPFALGSEELVELELYLRKRAAGMPIETPGVRP